MKPLVLAFWPAGFAASLFGLVNSDRSNTVEGAIVLEQASFCDFFVVEAQHHFVFLVDEDRWPIVVSSGSRVSGDLMTKGKQTVSVDRRVKLNVRVRGWDSDWNRVQARFADECDPNTMANAVRAAAEGD